MKDLIGTIVLIAFCSLVSFDAGHYFGWMKGYRDGKDGNDDTH